MCSCVRAIYIPVYNFISLYSTMHSHSSNAIVNVFVVGKKMPKKHTLHLCTWVNNTGKVRSTHKDKHPENSPRNGSNKSVSPTGISFITIGVFLLYSFIVQCLHRFHTTKNEERNVYYIESNVVSLLLLYVYIHTRHYTNERIAWDIVKEPFAETGGVSLVLFV